MKIFRVMKYITGIAGLLFLLIATHSCEYETIEIDLPDVEEPVSFSADIVPIFNDGNNCTACHGNNGTSPNLTADRAYGSIVPDLVNTDEPESSTIYVFPNSSSHSFKNYTQVQAALVLAWISQGAENN